MSNYKFKSSILGGTFDHFHIGHESFILSAFQQAEFVTVGIVENHFSTSKYRVESIEPYQTRLEALNAYLRKYTLENRANVIPINDIYGSSLSDASIEAIFVTDSTKPNALLINAKRESIGLPPLEIVVLPYSYGDDNQIISSGRIRGGEIDRRGKSYLKFFTQKELYILPAKLREALQNPLGTIVSSVEQTPSLIPLFSQVISIGDIVSIDRAKAKYPTDLCIIDYKTRRQTIDKKEIHKYFPIIDEVIDNPAGSINSASGNIILSLLSEFQQTKVTKVIAVSGEEDLLALPSILLAPLGTFIIYGQYQVGIVVVQVTEEIKRIAKKYLDMFD